MKRGIREWKAYARGALTGSYGVCILGMLAVVGISFLASTLTTSLFGGSDLFSVVVGQVFAFILSLIMCVFSAGLSYMFLNIARGKEHSLKDLLYLFKNHPDRVIVAGFVLAVIDLIASIPYYYVSYSAPSGSSLDAQAEWIAQVGAMLMLSMVLNMLLTLPFVLTYYLQADELEMGGIEALKESARLMKGHIGKYLLLQISFIPWIILSVFTLYIGLLWLMPYMEMTGVMFYRDLRGELDKAQSRPAPGMPGGGMYTQNPYGQAPYDQDPYGRNPYSQNPYGQEDIQTGNADNPDAQAEDGYAPDTQAGGTYHPDTQAGDSYTQAGDRRDTGTLDPDKGVPQDDYNSEA